MKKLSIFVYLLLANLPAALATWSIIIIDPNTKEIGIAAASCSNNCYGIGRIIPGKGAIIVQAMSNNDAREKGVELLLAGAKPDEIIQAMRNPAFDPDRQQYAVVMLDYLNQPAHFTGDSTYMARGVVTAPGISVQGNTLSDNKQLQVILEAVQKGQKEKLPLAEILMRALEAGSRSGGDKRCGEQRATSAFLLVAKPSDKTPSLDLRIFGQPKGGQNAVDMLRQKFDKRSL